MEIWKKYLPDVVAVVVFAVISLAYFMPATLDGRILYQHDASAGRGAGQEVLQYREQTGKISRWTNSTFGGMPTYQTSPSYQSMGVLVAATKAYHLWLPDYVWYVFAYLLGFYILLRAFDFRHSLAVLGAVVWAFSSYFFIIIAAGHIWKVMALAYLPPMIAGVILAYRGKWASGLVLTALFSAFEINANHVQMTYYYLFILLFIVIAYGVQAFRERQMTRFLKATLACIVGAALGICINLSNLYHTWQYGQESMRGKSELVKKNTANQTNSGLERDYITQWSYGIGETWTLLIPNAKGGTSAVPMSANKIVQEKGSPELSYLYQQMGQYWGEQPGTSGPVYVGAFVLMLFILGLFIVKGPMKWALLAATVLSILLSWGKNFMGLTDFFIDYVPMYAKFRTVASILVIAEFTIPLLAMLALKQIVDEPDLLRSKMKYLYVSFGLTAGMALLFALMPGVFFSDFISTDEMRALSQFPSEQLTPILTNLRTVRQAIFAADCWRTFWIIVIGTALLLLFTTKRLKAPYAIAAITLLCLVDMWQVNKRYLNDGMFVESTVRDTPQPLTPTDRQILQDKALDYRVLNLASNTFNENETSYYHKSIGGYHAAKLRRYQELIEAYISPEMQRLMPALVKAGGDMTRVNGDSLYPVLNMLNTKYFILPLQNNQTVPLQNPYAFGNAWMIDRISYVDNANAELDALAHIDLKHEAVADKRFQSVLGQSQPQGNVAKAVLTKYAPDQLTYSLETDKGGILVFSEVYYPEWTATVDGHPVEVGRVNYLLRAIHVKPGRHEVVLSFFPQSVQRTELVAYIAYALLVLLTIGLIFWNRKSKKRERV
ncbi:YfhO family protein [Prevotella sp. oral taxon 475]|uniref:YfhO family protein n=1 Tax=Prevotella sp. oral taxon 475 TaxID=712471 RepID=UPI001BA80EEE|nr:YfhO family protein [Prevotella sp. oral taxon 475]QUB46877.1 YfhO family protein [Prevotella sp. oral taxon 475]